MPYMGGCPHKAEDVTTSTGVQVTASYEPHDVRFQNCTQVF